MIIHVIQPYEDISRISKKYMVDEDSIKSINKIPNNTFFVPGQSILIPIHNDKYSNYEKYNTFEVNAFIKASSTPDKNTTLLELIKKYATCITYLSIFGYCADTNGRIKEIHDSDFISVALSNSISPIMVFTNYIEGAYEPHPFKSIINSQKNVNSFIMKIVNLLKRKGYGGICIDLKNLDPIYQESYFGFIYKLSIQIRASGLTFFVCVNGDQMINIDNNVYFDPSDTKILMPYRWGWSGSPPMPIAPLNQLEMLLQRTIRVFPENSVMLDLPLYGYDWKLPYNSKSSSARAISSDEAIELATLQKTYIHFDYISRSPYYNYIDEKNDKHIVWFEDIQSIWSKLEFTSYMGLKGISFWLSEKDYSLNWVMLKENFSIKK